MSGRHRGRRLEVWVPSADVAALEQLARELGAGVTVADVARAALALAHQRDRRELLGAVRAEQDRRAYERASPATRRVIDGFRRGRTT